ncbi:carbohydrate ABC transporter permease [Paenibacillus sp. N1-5-1-14]|uniref:carbohydrate ABC transporter permease n=1 Tax=Paenibacillus radicibacter TaxID=2972488 RepID=UPI002158C0F9|nr:carbohydrate ABC transporter permease [Paenibacillus radicibacter]MCR8643330.1 carbohydrate ABC transporter permease [Paenibacillus radicibacter]
MSSVNLDTKSIESRPPYPLKIKKPRNRPRTNWIALLLVIIISIILVAPAINLISTALKSNAELLTFPPRIIPKTIVWSNFSNAFERYPILTWYKNSIFVALMSVIGTVLSSSFVAFGFARYRAKGKQALFTILLATMMIPYPAIMLPQFVLFTNLGWMDSFAPIVVPTFFGSAYIIFLLRQFFTSLPNELFEAARMDGCSEFRQWWSIALPLSGPALATSSIFTFIWTWNDLIGQVMYLNSSNKFTLAIGMASMAFSNTRLIPWNLVMVVSILSIIPIVIIFAVAQKYFVRSIVLTGVK